MAVVLGDIVHQPFTANNGIQIPSVAIDAILYNEISHDDHRLVPITTMPVGAIGWTQNTISPKVYNVTEKSLVEIQTVVTEALEDPRGALAFMREYFPDPIRVFDSGKHGTLSIDNRRLAIYRMVVSSDTQIPVRMLTQEQAGQAVASAKNRPDDLADAKSATKALRKRYSTKDGGYSIKINGQPGSTVSQGDCYIRSPFVVCPSSCLSWIVPLILLVM